MNQPSIVTKSHDTCTTIKLVLAGIITIIKIIIKIIHKQSNITALNYYKNF